ncbi:MAG: RICIN domain-containing protein [Clostridia bacterium]|nr:RICIN domain-containing protein [Clostridia bacterium]
MKKAALILFIFSAICVLATASFASDKDKVVGKCDCAISVEEAHTADKVAALESASAQLQEGTAPEKTVYFSGKARRRNVGDGYYTISETSTDMCFNVDTDGADTDYEGIRLTVWEHTEDITQRFRLVMNEDGSYTFFAACSRGGYKRAVGLDPYTGALGLFSPESEKCATFFIKNSGAGNGMKYIVLSSDETKYLAIPRDPFNSAPAVLASLDDETCLFEWKISNWGDSAAEGGERAMYPGNILIITQGPFDEYSHEEQNAIDMQVMTDDSITAPFTCRVVAVNEECGNVVWIESTSEVLYADGTYDYMTCLFMHDDDISDIYVGEIILQGQPFYEMGTAGYAEGAHCHISCFRGQYSPSLKISNLGPEAVDAWDAFYLPNDITVRIDHEYPWVYAPQQ